MGRVPPPGEVRRARKYETCLDSTRHILAIREIMRVLEHHRSSKFDVAIQFYGSSVTGNVSPYRGDLDALVCYGRLKDDRQYNLEEVPFDERESLHIFISSIKIAINKIAKRYHVYPEIRYVNFVDIRLGSSGLTDDPGYLGHLVDIRDNHPGFTMGDPLGYVESYAIDPHGSLTDTQESLLVSSSLRYMTNRANFFYNAQKILPEHVALKALQRALEFAKAVARKTIQVDAVNEKYTTNDGDLIEVKKDRMSIKPDVTSRKSMYASFEALTGRVDKDGTMKQSHALLVELDAEFETLLERTIKGEVSIREYTQWLGSRYLIAIEAALTLALSCHRYVEDVAWDNGIEVIDAHDEQLYRPFLIGTGKRVDIVY